MSEKLIENIKELDRLQGIIYQNLMTAFNNLEIAINLDIESKMNVENVQQLKHIVLSALKKGVGYVNSTEFKNACIVCSAVRLIAISKYIILTDFKENNNIDEAVKNSLQDSNMDKKYIIRFFEAVNDLKAQISKFIVNNSLKKQFLIDNFCIQHIKKEKLAVEKTFPDDKKFIIPDWAKEINEEKLENITSQLIEYLQNEDYKGLNSFITEKNYF